MYLKYFNFFSVQPQDLPKVLRLLIQELLKWWCKKQSKNKLSCKIQYLYHESRDNIQQPHTLLYCQPLFKLYH